MITITKEFEYLMALMGTAATGKVACNDISSVDIDLVIKLAKEQTVLPLAASVLKDQGRSVVGDDWFKELRTIVISSAIQEERRKSALYEILDVLEKHGVKYAILKGMTLETLYSKSLFRISADVDLYVGEQYEEEAQRILCQHGTHVNKRDPRAQEAVCSHPVIGTIELHAHLLNKEDREYWFSKDGEFTGITQPFKQIIMPDGRLVKTLGDDDNVLFLSMHVIKHFIRGGTSLRNIMDIALFIRYYAKQHDMLGYWARLHSLHYDGIINAALSACVYYAGFSENDFPGMMLLDRSIVDDFMTDLEVGGCMGINDSERRVSSGSVYDRIAFKRNRGGNSAQYLWSKRRRLSSFLKMNFSKAYLKKKYIYVCKHTWLLPIASIHNLCSYTWRVISRRTHTIALHDTINLAEADQNRIKLFKQLGIF